jgi:hypothetical protein
VALPLDRVGQIIEYPVYPLPLARRFVGGLGVFDGRVLLSIALARAPDRGRGQQRPARGILLDARAKQEGDEVEWAFEVDELGAFVRATLVTPAVPSPDLPAWISQARDGEGKLLGWIDVAAMLADLAGGEG